MRLLFGKLTTSDTIFSLDNPLWEVRILQSPEAEESGLKLFIIRDIDVEFTITGYH